MLRILLLALLPGACLSAVSCMGCSTSKIEVQAEMRPVKAPVAPDLYGLVKAVDADRKTVTLRDEDKDREDKEKTYEVAEDAKILLKGPGKLADLAVGTRVALVFDANRKVAAEIRTEPFRITATPKEKQVEVNKPFDVELRVVNASALPQTFYVMSCSWYDQWSSSNPRVSSVAWPCKMNVPTLVKLPPGEVYAKTLPMRITVAESVSFRMGLTPREYRESSPPKAGKRTYWSNEITIKVR